MSMSAEERLEFFKMKARLTVCQAENEIRALKANPDIGNHESRLVAARTEAHAYKRVLRDLGEEIGNWGDPKW